MNSKITQYYATLLLLILAFAFFTRVFRVHQPEGYIFDEVYHAVTAKLISQNDPRAYEWWNPPPEPDTAVDWLHPPLAKYTQAFFIYFLGENSFAWRFSSVVFGVSVVWLTAILTKELFDNKPLSLLAGLLVSLDGLLLVQSRIAMNDIHVTFFILLTFLLYWKHLKQNLQSEMYQYSHYLFFAGISAGLAISSKWSGAFSLALIGLIEGSIWLHSLWLQKSKILKSLGVITEVVRPLIKIAISLLLIPAVVYLLSYTHMFLQGKDLSHFIELHQQTWHYQTNLDATHPAQSRPWQWFLNLKPVWLAVDYVDDTLQGNIYAFGNPVLFLLGAISVVWTGIFLITQLKNSNKHLPLLYVLLCYLVVWVPWHFSPRIMFFYHYAPAVPLMTILLSYWLYTIWSEKKNTIYRGTIISAIVLTVVAFVVWYPHWTNIPVPISFADNVYFLLESWQ